LQSAPVFALAVVLSIGVGLGLNVTLLAIVRGVLLRPLAVSEPERLFSIYLSDVRRPRPGPFPYPVYDILRQSSGPLSDVFGFVEFQEPVLINGFAEFVTGEFITPTYFDSLRVPAVFGRTIASSDDRSSDSRRVVVVSERFWRERLGADVNWLGRSISINSQELTLLGVVPSSFRGMNLPSIAPTDLWVLFSIAHEVSPRFEQRFRYAFSPATLRLRARLPNGVTHAVAQGYLTELLDRLGTEHRALRGKIAIVQRSDKEMLFPTADKAAWSIAGVLLALGALVLLIVVANLIHLFLSRVVDRLPDVATRRMLGAGRLVAAAPLLRETGWLTALGVLLSIGIGILFSTWLTQTAAAYGRPYGLSFDPLIDWQLHLLTLLIGLGIATLCVSVPALLATRNKVVYSVFRQCWTAADGRWATRLRTGLVATQFVVATAVVVIAASFFWAAREVATRDIGLKSDAVLVGLDATRSDAYRNPQELFALQQRVVTRVRSLPSVKDAILIDFLPIGTRRDPATVNSGSSAETSKDIYVSIQRVAPRYFDIVKTPLIAGRDFTDADVVGQPMVAIVSETAAQRIWRRAMPIGETITVSIRNVTAAVTIVGVARDTDVRFIGERHWPLLYVPLAQHPSPEFHILAETLSAGQGVSFIAAEVRKIDPRVPIVRTSTVNDWIATWMYPYRLAAILTGSFALVAWIVSSVGSFGLAHYWTSTRNKEFGIRQALGASPKRILALVLRQHVVPLVLSINIGLVVGRLGVTMTSRIFFRMVTLSAPVIAVVYVMAIAVGLVATAMAARNAVLCNPSESLRRL
jgi:predicted permease